MSGISPIEFDPSLLFRIAHWHLQHHFDDTLQEARRKRISRLEWQTCLHHVPGGSLGNSRVACPSVMLPLQENSYLTCATIEHCLSLEFLQDSASLRFNSGNCSGNELSRSLSRITSSTHSHTPRFACIASPLTIMIYLFI